MANWARQLAAYSSQVAGVDRSAAHVVAGTLDHVIRTMVIDDEPLVRSGLHAILSADPEIDVVATADDRDAIAVANEVLPDVVLLDIRMPHRDGLSILTELLTMVRPPIVGILTTFDADEYVHRALKLGATGFLLKDTEPRQLSVHVKTLAAGGVVLSPTVTRSVISGFADARECSAARTMVASLSDRERDVLALVSQGKSNREIAESIHHSVGTVKDDMGSILTRLRVASRVEAALIAQQAGLV